ncbi:MAG: protease modulator HflC [Myxococcota bacterium]
MRRLLRVFLILLLLALGLLVAGNRGWGPFVVTQEGETKIVFMLGEVWDVTQPGLSFRVPFLQRVETYDTRWLYLNTEPLPIQTRDGEELNVDNYVIWRISDPVEFRRAFRSQMSNARARIDRVVRDDVREVIGRHTLLEVLEVRRGAIMQEIAKNSRDGLGSEGVEIGDVRINRTELPEGTEESVYARMRTERERLAKKSRAEGDERARRVRAKADREALVIVANAQRDAEITRGEGDARAAAIYAEGYSEDPAFYAFTRSLKAYRSTLAERTTLVLSPDSEFFRYLEGAGPVAGPP